MKRSIGAKTLVYPTPTWIVGSYDKQGKPNGMVAAWGGIRQGARWPWAVTRPGLPRVRTCTH